jgi:hypothetical protein
MAMPRIAVLNRLHLDEWLSGDVAAILEGLQGHRDITCFSRDAPPEGWPRQRGYDGNITECFPGKPNGTTEEREAWLITQLCRDAELVLDIRGNNEPDNDFPFYGISPLSGPLVREDDALKHRLKREYPSLARLPDKAIRALNFPTPAYANCWNADAYGHTGYWGEVAVAGVPQGQHQ